MAWLWLSAIFERALGRKPPLTLAEWDFLKRWLQGRHQDLAKRGSIRLLVGEEPIDADKLWREVQNLDGKNPRCNKLVDQLRALYARYHHPPQLIEQDEDNDDADVDEDEED